MVINPLSFSHLKETLVYWLVFMDRLRSKSVRRSTTEQRWRFWSSLKLACPVSVYVMEDHPGFRPLMIKLQLQSRLVWRNVRVTQITKQSHNIERNLNIFKKNSSVFFSFQFHQFLIYWNVMNLKWSSNRANHFGFPGNKVWLGRDSQTHTKCF